MLYAMLWYDMTNEWKYVELYAMVWDSNGIRFQCYGIRLQCYAMLCYAIVHQMLKICLNDCNYFLRPDIHNASNRLFKFWCCCCKTLICTVYFYLCYIFLLHIQWHCMWVFFVWNTFPTDLFLIVHIQFKLCNFNKD